MAIEVRIPQLGESVSEGVIARWLKRDGEVVTADEPVLELETDKAAMEIPAGAAGKLRILMREGATVTVGAVVAKIEEAEPAAAAPAAGSPSSPAPSPARAGEDRATPDGDGDRRPPARAPERGAPEGAEPERAAPERVLSPAVRKLVAEQHLEPSEIAASGKGGRVTKGDVLRHLEESRAPGASEESPRPVPTDEEERVAMTSLRRRIAER